MSGWLIISSTEINFVISSFLASFSSLPSLLGLPLEWPLPTSWLSLLSLLPSGELRELVSEGGVSGLAGYCSGWSDCSEEEDFIINTGLSGSKALPTELFETC